jgi:acylpyruvate hydrolase
MFNGLLVSYRTDDGWQLGALDRGRVAPLAVPVTGQYSAMRTLLNSGADAFRAALTEAGQKLERDAGTLAVAEVILGPTVPDPDKILCVGFNYDDHTAEMQVERPAAPNVFAKFRNGLIGDQAGIPVGPVSSEVDYEGELAVIMGRRCHAVGTGEALDYVAGFSVANDVSARDLQFRTSQWTLGKAIDGFFPLGPGLAPAARVGDPQRLRLVTKVNGRTVQDGSTQDMVFGVARLVSELSGLMTLEPGDVISTGTPAGVGYKSRPPRFLRPGDTVQIVIERVGTLTNRVIAAVSMGTAASTHAASGAMAAQ